MSELFRIWVKVFDNLCSLFEIRRSPDYTIEDIEEFFNGDR